MKYTLNGNLFKNVEHLQIKDLGLPVKVKDYIVHGCNAQGVMASGFAKAVREKFPEAYEDYMYVHEKYGLTVGETITVPVTSKTIIINAITQYNYGRDRKVRYVDYTAVESCFKEILQHALADADLGYNVRIHYPKIGVGLGGGD